jgi:hypothetical protein
MVGALPPIRHVIAITAKDQQGRSSAREHDQTFFIFFLNGRHSVRSRKLQKS